MMDRRAFSPCMESMASPHDGPRFRPAGTSGAHAAPHASDGVDARASRRGRAHTRYRRRVRLDDAEAVTPRPGANSTTSAPGRTARLRAQVPSARPPGRSTVLPAREHPVLGCLLTGPVGRASAVI